MSTFLADGSVAAAAPVAAERPLSSGRMAALVATATGVLLLFYVWAVVVLAAIGVALVVGAVAALAAARVGLMGVVVGWLQRLVGVGGVVLRSLGVSRGADYRMPLSRADAPRLFERVERLSARLGMAPPDQVALEMGANAYVELRGVRTGRGRTTLGIGLDFLAVLTERQLEAVLAHEVAHARLIQRGWRGWLNGGNARMQQAASGLRMLAEATGKEDRPARLPGALAMVPERLGRTAACLAMAYSRQHEFAADRLAAETCGTETVRDTLVFTHVLGETCGRASWRDRVLQAERGGSMTEWLRERITPAGTERARMEAKAMAAPWTVEDGTHPALRDRVDALPRSSARGEAGDEPASALLADPDGVAVRLVRHLEGISDQEARKESDRLRRVVRKNAKAKGTELQRFWRMVSLVGGVVVAWFAILAAVDGAEEALRFADWIAVGAAALVGGALLMRQARWRERTPLPVPPVAAWEDAIWEPADRTVGDWTEAVERDVHAGVPGGLSRGKRARRLAEEAYRALAACDYRRALVAAALSQKEKPGIPEAQVAEGIAGAYFGAEGYGALGPALAAAGAGPSLSWAIGWAAALRGEWGTAEAYLLDATDRGRDEPTILAVLAHAQWRTGKAREAARTARRAAGRGPAEPRHRILATHALLSEGLARSAREELAALEAGWPEHPDVLAAGVRTRVLLGEDGEALRLAARFAVRHPGAETEIRVGNALLESASAAAWTAAEAYFRHAVERGGRPDAFLGLARAAWLRHDWAASRAHLLAALDLTRAVDPAATPPADLFPTVCRGLLALGEEEPCGAWWVAAELGENPAGFARLHVLVCHRAPADAVRFAGELRGALVPGGPRGDEGITWEDAPADERPTGPLVPGAYRYRFESVAA